MVKKLVSLGSKHGGTPRITHTIDVRQWGFLNPHFHPDLKHKTGLDPEVRAYLESDPGFEGEWDRFCREVLKLVEVVGAYTVYVMCTGGKHRSVYLVGRLGRELGVEVEHRDLNR